MRVLGHIAMNEVRENPIKELNTPTKLRHFINIDNNDLGHPQITETYMKKIIRDLYAAYYIERHPLNKTRAYYTINLEQLSGEYLQYLVENVRHFNHGTYQLDLKKVKQLQKNKTANKLIKNHIHNSLDCFHYLEVTGRDTSVTNTKQLFTLLVDGMFQKGDLENQHSDEWGKYSSMTKDPLGEFAVYIGSAIEEKYYETSNTLDRYREGEFGKKI